MDQAKSVGLGEVKKQTRVALSVRFSCARIGVMLGLRRKQVRIRPIEASTFRHSMPMRRGAKKGNNHGTKREMVKKERGTFEFEQISGSIEHFRARALLELFSRAFFFI